MNRRRFLSSSLGALAGLAFSKAGASADFEAFRSSQQEQLQGFQGQRAAEFDAYQKELQAAFAAYKRSYAEAAEAQRQELAALWPNAELSSQTRWIEYSSDKTIQRVVDFEQNQIILRLHPQAGAVSESQIARELQTILQADQASAFERDPVSQAVEREVAAAAPNATQQAAVAPKLILGELFSSPRPAPAEVQRTAQRLAATAARSVSPNPGKLTVTVNLPAERPLRKAEEFAAVAAKFAKQWQVDPALVLAVMHTESAFNPMARSPVPAYGLMQIVPESAGQDATQLVHGKPRIVAPSYLYDAEKNIELGAAYLHLLQTRYLRAIVHPESRLYCAIAAYNTGAGNVARSYTGASNVAKAAPLINQRSPQANYEHLRANLPYEETRNYLQRVVARIPAYRQL